MVRITSSWCNCLLRIALPLLLGLQLQLVSSVAQAKDDKAPQVIIVGGGMAGLITAYELQNAGVTSHVLEANDYWGGRLATIDYGNGLKAEYGMHEVWARDPLTEYVKKFNIPMSTPEEPYSSAIIDGKYYPYVQDNAEKYLATLFTADEKAGYDRWLKECESLYDEAEAKGLTPRLLELQKISFATWVGKFAVTPKVEEFIRMGLECEIAIDWDSVSAVYGIMQSRIFLHGTEQCFHAKGGNRKIIDAFVKAIKGPMTLGARVVRIVHSQNPDGSTTATIYYIKDSVMRTITAPKVVVATQHEMLHAIQMEPSLTDQQWQAVDSLVAGLYTVVHLIMSTDANKFLLADADHHPFAEGRIPFPIISRGPLGVVYGFLEKPPAAQKEEIFSVLIHGDYTRTYLQPYDKVREKILGELNKIWPDFSKYVHAAYFYGYHPVATPAWPVGRSPLDDLHASLRQENAGLYLVGDYIFSSHAEGAVRSGREVAKKIAAALVKK